jgi:DNA-directed RNA polymerase III subunit RPC3
MILSVQPGGNEGSWANECHKKIFKALADYGRQTFLSLHQATRITGGRLRTGLGVLIQHHILYFHSEDPEADDIPTYFQINWNNAYGLVRTGKLVKLVTDREGEAAGNLLGNVIYLGHASVGDIAAEYGLNDANKRDSGIDNVENHIFEEGLLNGAANATPAAAKIASLSEFHSLMRMLLQKQFLVKVGERSYWPQVEYDEFIKQETIEKEFPGGKITGPKTSLQYTKSFNDRKRSYEEMDSYKSSRDDATRGSIKETGAFTSNKRIKLNGDTPNGIHHTCEPTVEQAEAPFTRLPVLSYHQLLVPEPSLTLPVG